MSNESTDKLRELQNRIAVDYQRALTRADQVMLSGYYYELEAILTQE